MNTERLLTILRDGDPDRFDLAAFDTLRRALDRMGAQDQGPAPACEVAVCADPDAQPFVWLSGERARAREEAREWHMRHPVSQPSPLLHAMDWRLAEAFFCITETQTDLERMLTCLHNLPQPFDQRDLRCHSPPFRLGCYPNPSLLFRTARDNLRIFDLDP